VQPRAAVAAGLVEEQACSCRLAAGHCQPCLDAERDDSLRGFRVAVMGTDALTQGLLGRVEIVAFQVHQRLGEVGGHRLQGVSPASLLGLRAGGGGELGSLVGRTIEDLQQRQVAGGVDLGQFQARGAGSAGGGGEVAGCGLGPPGPQLRKTPMVQGDGTLLGGHQAVARSVGGEHVAQFGADRDDRRHVPDGTFRQHLCGEQHHFGGATCCGVVPVLQHFPRAGDACRDGLVVGGMEKQHHGAEDQLRGRGGIVRRHPLQDLEECALLRGEDERSALGGDDLSNVRPVMGGDGMVQRLYDGVVAGVPPGGAAVQFGHRGGALQRQTMRQDIPQQGVVAEPEWFRAEPDDEIVVVLQLFEHALRVVLCGDRVGEVGTDPLTDARLEQELPLPRRAAGQDLVGQVVIDAADVTGEVGDRSPTVAAGEEAGSQT
jgi:hypothetical protein